MAEDFQSSNWWKSSRSGGFDGGSPAVSSISCTTSIADVTGGGPFNWSDAQLAEAKARPGEELASSIPISSNTTANIPLMDSTLQISGFGLSTPTMDWNQTVHLCSSSSGRAYKSFEGMLQEELSSRPSSTFFRRQSAAMDPGESSRVPIKDINDPNYLLENSISDNPGLPIISSSSSYEGCSPAAPMLQGLFESLDMRTQHSFFVDSQQMVDYQSQMLAYRGVPNEMQQLIKAFPQQPQQQSATSQLQFTNITPFWNASGSSSQICVQPFDLKQAGSSNLTMKSSEGVREKKTNNEPSMKKIRMETPSSLPTFKVRKEKLGDRITALQQLVSPFGKTDTASVLHEAIDYIKFLHEQVSVLCTPYLKNGHSAQQQRQVSIKHFKAFLSKMKPSSAVPKPLLRIFAAVKKLQKGNGTASCCMSRKIRSEAPNQIHMAKCLLGNI